MKNRNEKLLSDLLYDLEASVNCLEDIDAVLFLYFDNLFNAVQVLDPNQPWTVECFTKQFDAYLSPLLNIIQRDLRCNLGELRSLYEKSFSAYTSNKKVVENEDNHSISTK